MREVILCGALGRTYGRRFMLDVRSPAEAVKALCANFPKLTGELRNADERGVRYAVWSGRENIGVDQLRMSGSAPIRIAPVLVGSKKGGLLQTIAGAVLVVVGIVLYNYGGGYLTNLGIGLIEAGAALTLGGIAQLLTPIPRTQQQQNSRSDLFSGPINVTTEGGPVPLILGGPILIGSTVIGTGIDVDDVAVNAPRAALTADASTGGHPLTVHFDATNSSATVGNLTQFLYTFGDGTSVEQAAGTGVPLPGAHVSHTYTAAGTYSASLAVLNDSGFWSPMAYLTIVVS